MTATRVDTPRGRYYDVAGARYPSVTHILSVVGKPALVNWAASVERDMVVQQATRLYGDAIDRQLLPALMPPSWFETTLTARLGAERAHQKQLAQAGEIGSQVHALIEWYLYDDAVHVHPGRVSDAALRAYDHFREWFERAAVVVHLIEHTVYSDQHGYAGTLDLLASVQGRRMVIDFKTSKAVYPEAHLQNAAYQAAALEMGLGPIDGGLIVRLPKHESDPTFEVVEVAPADTLLPIFLAARTLWAFLQEHAR